MSVSDGPNAASIYMTPLEILKRLAIFEKKFQVFTEQMYVPSMNGNNFSIQDINDEAQKIFKHAGIANYIPKCVFNPHLPSTTAACVDPSYKNFGSITIEINPLHKNNWKVLLAAIAHETCHVVNRYYNIDTEAAKRNDIAEVEILAELCTMYVGFGNLVLRGYGLHNAGGRMGYFENASSYEDAWKIVKMVRFGEDCNFDDPLLKSVMARFKSRKDYVYSPERELTFARIERNVKALKQLLALLEKSNCERYRDYHKKVEDAFKEQSQISSQYRQKPFTALLEFYTKECIDVDDGKVKEEYSTSDEKLAEALAIAIGLMCEVNDASDLSEFRYTPVKCPFCGTLHPYMIENEEKNLKCPECNNIFKADCTHITKKSALAAYRSFIAKIREEGKMDGIHIGYDEGKKGAVEDAIINSNVKFSKEYNEKISSMKSRYHMILVFVAIFGAVLGFILACITG